jgi:hypothetical protein
VDQNFKKWGISAIEIEILENIDFDFRFFGKKYRFRFRFEAIEIEIEIGITLRVGDQTNCGFFGNMVNEKYFKLFHIFKKLA